VAIGSKFVPLHHRRSMHLNQIYVVGVRGDLRHRYLRSLR
jgi:hypothetical protein